VLQFVFSHPPHPTSSPLAATIISSISRLSLNVALPAPLLGHPPTHPTSSQSVLLMPRRGAHGSHLARPVWEASISIGRVTAAARWPWQPEAAEGVGRRQCLLQRPHHKSNSLFGVAGRAAAWYGFPEKQSSERLLQGCKWCEVGQRGRPAGEGPRCKTCKDGWVLDEATTKVSPGPELGTHGRDVRGVGWGVVEEGGQMHHHRAACQGVACEPIRLRVPLMQSPT